TGSGGGVAVGAAAGGESSRAPPGAGGWGPPAGRTVEPAEAQDAPPTAGGGEASGVGLGPPHRRDDIDVEKRGALVDPFLAPALGEKSDRLLHEHAGAGGQGGIDQIA